MKNILLFTLLIIFSIPASFAQLAKMQFEDAEAAYSEGKFAETVKLLDEAEQSNKGVNPAITHLRILARTELIKQNPDKDFDIIDKARKEAELFLKQYDGNEELEDKYREVYQASKLLKDLPLTRAQFDENIRGKKEASEKIRMEKMRKFFSYGFIKDFEKGYTLESFRKKSKAKDKYFDLLDNGDKQYRADNVHVDPHYIIFRKDIAIGYRTWDSFFDNQAHEKGKRLLTEKIEAFKDLFGFDPEIEENKYSVSTSSGTTYTWKLQHKTIIVQSEFYISRGYYSTIIYYIDYDESFIQM
ncbi:hypothetical protein ACFOTA_15350 [Chitinophaga sp. GCM10012297]|uniref:Uncharacterized protein n=1 Tax=Chitinophaga chungangae TaxID=2821488 RepID=A0ABS3YFY3_9BACT|nr:hypothetical protein [Chitinophaga chungangae]MBO9153596.1 hypothetical protein [Chitinophaga chungangae]